MPCPGLALQLQSQQIFIFRGVFVTGNTSTTSGLTVSLAKVKIIQIQNQTFFITIIVSKQVLQE